MVTIDTMNMLIGVIMVLVILNMHIYHKLYFINNM